MQMVEVRLEVQEVLTLEEVEAEVVQTLVQQEEQVALVWLFLNINFKRVKLWHILQK